MAGFSVLREGPRQISEPPAGVGASIVMHDTSVRLSDTALALLHASIEGLQRLKGSDSGRWTSSQFNRCHGVADAPDETP